MQQDDGAAAVERSPTAVTALLFTDLEGSSRLWEQDPERMRPALAEHDALARAAVRDHHGRIVKMTGDGIYAAFPDPLDALHAVIELQSALADPAHTHGIALRARCGVHVGVVAQDEADFHGNPVNRAARIMNAAHGGQVLLSQAAVDLVRDRLPQDASLQDLGRVRLRDLSTPEHLYQLVHPGLRREFPALRSLESTPNNLPQQVTSFVGREHELQAVKELLARSRLVTLIGAGGIGKTRLSLQVAADAMDAFPDGVWLIELAGLTDPQLVPQAVASVLGVKEDTGCSLLDSLLRFVADRRLLVILDNCEHLDEAAATIARQLLGAGPDAKVLASSRERLHDGGEATFQVPPLSVPDPDHPPQAAALAQFGAVRLFRDRAASVRSGFEVTARNAAAITNICHRLDGIPLALELAAARVRAMSVEQIATRLDDRFRLLTSSDRTALPRQQTLRALIDWSYDLLTEPERLLLQRLSVFAGGWTLDAAEAVGTGGAISRDDVLDLLTRLVEKSLVLVEAEGERYRLLESVQQYAREHLAQSGDEATTRTRHLMHYIGLYEKGRSELVGPEQKVWLERLNTERENLLAAHAWCDHADNGAELGLRLVSAARRYWIFGGLLNLGYRVTSEALARSAAGSASLARCRALFDIGQLGSWMGRYAEAQRQLEESLAIARAVGDTRSIAVVLQPLAMACLGQGDATTAREHLTAALGMARELGDKREIASALNALAQLHRGANELDRAGPLLRDAIALARDLNDREFTAIGLLNLAMVAIGENDGTAACGMLLEAIAIAEQTGSKPIGQSALDVCAGLAACYEQWEHAARFYGAAEMQTGETGLHRDAADEAFLTPLVTRTRERLGAEAFAEIESAGAALSDEAALREAKQWLLETAKGRNGDSGIAASRSD